MIISVFVDFDKLGWVGSDLGGIAEDLWMRVVGGLCGFVGFGGLWGILGIVVIVVIRGIWGIAGI